jgi:hypothetical protein
VTGAEELGGAGRSGIALEWLSSAQRDGFASPSGAVRLIFTSLEVVHPEGSGDDNIKKVKEVEIGTGRLMLRYAH